MSNLREIDDAFVDEYILAHRNELSKPVIGGTDWRFADIVAPAFKEILEIARPERIFEIGFNIGGSALMFLMINPELRYWSIDILENRKSIEYLLDKYPGFMFVRLDSRVLEREMFSSDYNLVIIDGDHTREGVLNDIEKALSFKPGYILFDDVKHPSHGYIWGMIQNDDRLEVVKLYEFDQCWKGYSFALCKVK